MRTRLRYPGHDPDFFFLLSQNLSEPPSVFAHKKKKKSNFLTDYSPDFRIILPLNTYVCFIIYFMIKHTSCI